MDPERERIQADLRGLLEGEVHCDDLFTQIYASDASIYEIKPLGASSKLNAEWTVLQHLHDIGWRSAERWLDQHFDELGLLAGV